MSTFDDMYLPNYKVLNYGLVCKNNPKSQTGSSFASVRSGCSTHLSFWVFFLPFGHVENMACPGSFLC